MSNQTTTAQFFVVRYYREALTTSGVWSSVMDSGFVTGETTLAEVKAKVAEIVGWHDGVTSRISTPVIRLISAEERERILASDECFWSKAINKATVRAIERFRQGNA